MCRTPRSRARPAVPSSLPKRRISGRGNNRVQLVMALRWIVAKWPRECLGMAKRVSIEYFSPTVQGSRFLQEDSNFSPADAQRIDLCGRRESPIHVDSVKDDV